MGFKASTKVSRLDYNFQPYSNAHGVTPEFPEDSITAYWSEFGEMLRANRDALRDWDERREALPKDESGKADRGAEKELEDQFRTWQDENVVQMRQRRLELLAALCSDQPTVEDLKALPPRVFDAFETAMQEELNPKA